MAVHSCTAAQKTAEASAQRLPETERERGEGDQRLPSHLPPSKSIFSFSIFFIEIDSSLIQYITTILSPLSNPPGSPHLLSPQIYFSISFSEKNSALVSLTSRKVQLELSFSEIFHRGLWFLIVRTFTTRCTLYPGQCSPAFMDPSICSPPPSIFIHDSSFNAGALEKDTC